MRFIILILLISVPYLDSFNLDNNVLIIEKSGTKYNTIIIEYDKSNIVFEIGDKQYEINCNDVEAIFDKDYIEITDVYCTDNSKKPQKIISPIFFGLSGALQLIIWEADEFELDFNEIETIDKVKASSLIIGSVFLSRELKKISHHNFSYYINPVKTNPTLNLSFKF